MVPAVQEITLIEFTTDIVKVLNAFCSQVLQAIPPPKHNNPNNILCYHSCRDPDNPYSPSVTHFNNHNLWLAGFIQLQTCDPQRDDWEDRFEYLFPSKFRIIHQNQFGRPRKPDAGQVWNYQGLGGYKNCTYLESWMNIMARATPEGAAALRAQAQDRK
jgi:hypothetical protein